MIDETCSYVEDGVRCGKPAVEHVDVDFKGIHSRLYLCADHSDQRDELLQGGPEFS